MRFDFDWGFIWVSRANVVGEQLSREQLSGEHVSWNQTEFVSIFNFEIDMHSALNLNIIDELLRILDEGDCMIFLRFYFRLTLNTYVMNMKI